MKQRACMMAVRMAKISVPITLEELTEPRVEDCCRRTVDLGLPQDVVTQNNYFFAQENTSVKSSIHSSMSRCEQVYYSTQAAVTLYSHRTQLWPNCVVVF